MLGGGTFTVQNKVLPGAYINFVSASRGNMVFGERGYAAMGLMLDWGPDGEIFTVESGDFIKSSMKIFGYSYDAEELRPLRDLFLGAKTLYCYRLNGNGKKASNVYAEALYKGKRGNDITIVIEETTEESYEVITRLGNTQVDTQTVKAASDLKPNDYVTFKTGAELAATAGTPLDGGENSSSVTGAEHQAFLEKAESYSFNTMGCISDDDAIKSLYIAYTKRMRDEVGAKFQCVVYNKAADYEGVINVKNSLELIYWVTGISAGCEVNKSNLNRLYDGETEVDADYTQAQLEAALKAGEFVLHRVGDEIRVLGDINSLVSYTDTKGEVFNSNQTVRVCDQIANDIAKLFNTYYLGKVQNDEMGRNSLRAEIVKHHESLESIRAIEGFEEDDVTVEQGEQKDGVLVTDAITVTYAMGKLYMIVTVS